MDNLVDSLTAFLTTSSFWSKTLMRLDDPDVIFHESRVETSLDPIALEYLFRRLLESRGANVRNVGHAVHGDLAWIKMYSIGSPVFNLVWHYRSNTIIAPYEAEPFATWRHSDIDAYLTSFSTRVPTSADIEVVDDYLSSDHWQEHMLAKIADPEIEHFHVYLETDLDPRFLEIVIREALRRNGVISYVPAFVLANPRNDPPGIWVGHAPDGFTSWEVALHHRPGVALRPANVTEAEREYGGDGWTNLQYKTHLDRFAFDRLTLNEADTIVGRVTSSPTSHDSPKASLR